MYEVYLGLGSNLGDRETYLRRALSRLGTVVGGLRVAPIYETEPLDGAGPGLFLNTVAQGWTSLDPIGLLRAAGEIEADLGRTRPCSMRRCPRTIDIDVLLFSDYVREDHLLTVPHPRMTSRRFVLLPLLDLAPALADPRTGRPYRLWLQGLPSQGVRPYAGSPAGCRESAAAGRR